MSSGSGALSQFLLFLLFMASPTIFHAPAISVHAAVVVEANGAFDLKPVAVPGKGSLMVEEIRRRLGIFQVCAICTCCGGPKNLCMPSPCCYAINCNIPNRPFGFCAFTPKSCSCLGCHL